MTKCWLLSIVQDWNVYMAFHLLKWNEPPCQCLPTIHEIYLKFKWKQNKHKSKSSRTHKYISFCINIFETKFITWISYEKYNTIRFSYSVVVGTYRSLVCHPCIHKIIFCYYLVINRRGLRISICAPNFSIEIGIFVLCS